MKIYIPLLFAGIVLSGCIKKPPVNAPMIPIPVGYETTVYDHKEEKHKAKQHWSVDIFSPTVNFHTSDIILKQGSVRVFKNDNWTCEYQVNEYLHLNVFCKSTDDHYVITRRVWCDEETEKDTSDLYEYDIGILVACNLDGNE